MPSPLARPRQIELSSVNTRASRSPTNTSSPAALLFRLGKIPRAGDSVEYQSRRYTVLEMERNRIARVRIEKLPERPAPAG